MGTPWGQGTQGHSCPDCQREVKQALSASSLISAPPSGTSKSKHTGILEEDETIKERRAESSTTHPPKQAASSGCLGHPDPWTWGKKTGLK